MTEQLILISMIVLAIQWYPYGIKMLLFVVLLMAGALTDHGWLKRWRFIQTVRGFEPS